LKRKNEHYIPTPVVVKSLNPFLRGEYCFVNYSIIEIKDRRSYFESIEKMIYNTSVIWLLMSKIFGLLPDPSFLI
jgi:hypothetical protein